MLHCFLIASRSGHVVYERFYERLSEYEKADVRAALQLASGNVALPDGEQESIGVYKSACFVFIPYGDLILYLMGSGEYDELACAGIVRSIALVLRDVLKCRLSAAALLDKYPKMCMVVDEIINEGILETTDPVVVRKALKHKAAWE